MGDVSLLGILGLAFGLGMLHALDADHIMAVTGLSGQRPGFKRALGFCLRWAVGHGLSLCLIGAAVLMLGMAIPESLSHIAEKIIGLVLIAIGLSVLYDLYRKRAHLHFHHHDEMPPHAHWHQHTDHRDHDPRHHPHNHQAVIVGVLHGTAGSAPLLVLLPVSRLPDPWWGMAYLTVFAAGVILTMLVFGGLLGGVMQWLERQGSGFIKVVRAIIAFSAIGFGIAWLGMA